MAKKQPHVSQLLASRSEAATIFGVAEVTIDRLTARGELPVIKMPSTGKVGRPRNMYAVADLERFIESLRTYEDRPSQASARPHRSHGVHHSAREALRAVER